MKVPKKKHLPFADVWFNSRVARKYGLEEAILLQNIAYWCEMNKDPNHFHRGRYWMYNAARAFTEFFVFWSQDKIWRLLKSLESQGAILIDCFNKVSFDRTRWYALSDAAQKLFSR